MSLLRLPSEMETSWRFKVVTPVSQGQNLALSGLLCSILLGSGKRLEVEERIPRVGGVDVGVRMLWGLVQVL